MSEALPFLLKLQGDVVIPIEVLGLDEVAKLFGFKRPRNFTIAHRKKVGLPYHKTGRQVLFRRVDVEAALERNLIGRVEEGYEVQKRVQARRLDAPLLGGEAHQVKSATTFSSLSTDGATKILK